MHFTNNESGKLVIAERVVKTVGKICSKLTANDSNKLVYQYSNTHHHSIGKKTY